MPNVEEDSALQCAQVPHRLRDVRVELLDFLFEELRYWIAEEVP